MSNHHPIPARVALIKPKDDTADRDSSAPAAHVATSLILGMGKNAIQLSPEQSQIVIDQFLVLRRCAKKWHDNLASGSRMLIVDPPFIEAILAYLQGAVA